MHEIPPAPPRGRRCLSDLAARVGRAAAGDVDAWQRLIERWVPAIVDVGRSCFRDPDLIGEHLVRTIERLQQDEFAALRRFEAHADYDPEGRGWIRTIARRIAVNIIRAERGRQILPRAIETLRERRGEHIRALYYETVWKGSAVDWVIEDLLARKPELTRPQLEVDLDAVFAAVGPGLSARRVARRAARHAEPYDEVFESGSSDSRTGRVVFNDPRDMSAGDAAAVRREMLEVLLGRLVEHLRDREREMMRDRFWRGLSLREIARRFGLGSEYFARRRIEAIGEKLRCGLEEAGFDAELVSELLESQVPAGAAWQ